MIIHDICTGPECVVCVRSSHLPIRPTPNLVIYAVANLNPVRGLLDRKISEGHQQSFNRSKKNHRFSVCDSNIWIGVNPRVVVAPFARRHLWCICAAISVGSQCMVARFARRHLWGICGAVSVGSQCVVARFARGHLWCICAAVSLGSQCVVARFAQKHLTGICAAVSVESQ